MSEYYDWFRAAHLITVIFWMAGLLYLPRLYVYHSKAVIGGELDLALKTQERNLLRIIMNPSMIIAFLIGCALIYIRRDALSGSYWLWTKLILVFGLVGYHGFLAAMRKSFARGERPKSERFFRVINEIPAVITVVVVILAVTEPF